MDKVTAKISPLDERIIISLLYSVRKYLVLVPIGLMNSAAANYSRDVSLVSTHLVL